MITIAKFDTSGAEASTTQWNTLFQKAWQALAVTGDGSTLLHPDDKDLYDNGVQSFKDLGHYLSYIETLIELDPVYLMLPIDEEPFFINTNTREIDVPKAFETCSGVESDNYAEIVTFIVDRYFDYKDLRESTIAVQWKNSNAGTEGLSIIQLIDLETYGADNKIRFGWPLTKEMTKKAGNLQFAVRFFTREGNNFNYLLNTTVQSIPIKPTLELTNNIKENHSDYNYFKQFVRNSQNPYYGEAAPVTFYKNLPDTASLDENNGKILRAQALAADLNPITYRWYYQSYTPYLYDPIDDNGLSAWPSIKPDIEGGKFYTYEKIDGTEDEFEYKEISDTFIWPESKPNEYNLYVTGVPQILKDINGRYNVAEKGTTGWSQYAPITGSWPTTRPALNLWMKTEEDAYIPLGADYKWPAEKVTNLYVKDTYLEILPGSDDITGEYWVEAINEKSYKNTEGKIIVVNSAKATSAKCAVNPPEMPELAQGFSLDEARFLTDSNNTIQLSLAVDEQNPERTYKLYKINKGIYSEVDSGKVIKNKDTGLDETPVYTVESSGTYSYDITSIINRQEKVAKEIETITFYDLPKTPSAKMFVKSSNDDSGNKIDVTTDTFKNSSIYNGSYSKVSDDKGNIFETATFGEGTDTSLTTYELIVERDDEIAAEGDYQTITYTWSRQINSKEEIITKDLIDPKDGDILSLTADGNNSNTLKIRVNGSDADVSYKCVISNKIAIDNLPTESALSNTYIFALT